MNFRVPANGSPSRGLPGTNGSEETGIDGGERLQTSRGQELLRADVGMAARQGADLALGVQDARLFAARWAVTQQFHLRVRLELWLVANMSVVVGTVECDAAVQLDAEARAVGELARRPFTSIAYRLAEELRMEHGHHLVGGRGHTARNSANGLL